MFGIGSSELIVIFIVALLVLGPKRLPEAARALGRALALLQKEASKIKETKEIEDASSKDEDAEDS